MKNNSRKLIFGICAFLLATLSLGSCNSDDYLVDGGTSNPYFDGNVMQYLESRPDLFKDLVKVIKLTKWEDILTNEEVTFFAPTDFTIAKSVERMNYYLYNYQGMDKITELSQVKPAVWEDLTPLLARQRTLSSDSLPLQLCRTTLENPTGGTSYYGNRISERSRWSVR